MEGEFKVDRFLSVNISSGGQQVYLDFISGKKVFHHVLRLSDIEHSGVKPQYFSDYEIDKDRRNLEISFSDGTNTHKHILQSGVQLEGTFSSELLDTTESFIDYVYTFHGPNGSDPVNGCTREAIEAATKDYMKYEELIGDGYDRLKVRDLLPNFIK